MAAHQTDDPGPADSKRDDFLYEKPVIETISPHTSLNTPLDDEDDVHAGDVFPTAEEKATLRRVSDQIPWNAFIISFIELAERFSYFGTTVVFTNFIQQALPPGSRTGAGGADNQSGALGLGQRASTGLTTFNAFWVYVTPLFGAYLADSHWGRYKTICVSTGVAMIGQALLITSALPPVIAQSKVSLGVFVVAIIFMGTGTGGFKCNVNPLVAEQYRKTKLTVRETKTGERVIVDPVLTTSRIYMVCTRLLSVIVSLRDFLDSGIDFPDSVMSSFSSLSSFSITHCLIFTCMLSITVLLLLRQHRCAHRPNRDDIRRKGALPIYL
jgi:POT family proton-dependent oligopeptide transporter